MKKTFFNNSTRGGDLQAPTKTKRKVFRTFGFASLALLMGAAGVFAFAPLGTGPSVANANEMVETTTEQCLITPKADDPVIYTTESGLQIKMGYAVPDTMQPSLSSGYLATFPYFTTTKGSYTYTWVIIGRNSNVTAIDSAMKEYLFSTWKSNTSLNLNQYFFDSSYEEKTAAGVAIKNDTSSKGYVNDNRSMSISSTKINDDEIPSGCVLAFSNSTIYYNNEYWWYNSSATYCSAANQVFGGSNNGYTNQHKAFYNNDHFGFGNLLNSVQATTLTQRGYYNSSNTPVDTPCTLHFFPLGASSYDNFKYYTYLTANQCRASSSIPSNSKNNYNVWGRSMHNYRSICWTDAGSGNVTMGTDTTIQGWAIPRPACVIAVN